MSGEAIASVRCEIPEAAASRLKSASQRSKLASVRQLTAKAGPAVSATATSAAIVRNESWSRRIICESPMAIGRNGVGHYGATKTAENGLIPRREEWAAAAAVLHFPDYRQVP